jgi:hypothetical protein
MSRKRQWQPYDSQGRGLPPPYAPRSPAEYQVLDDGTLYDWDHEDLHYEGRQADGRLTLNEEACVRAYVQGTQLVDMGRATGLPSSLWGPIVTSDWFTRVTDDRQTLNFERGRAIVSQAFPDAAAFVYALLRGNPDELRRLGIAEVPGVLTRLNAAETLMRYAPQAEQQGALGRRVRAIQADLDGGAGGALAEMGEVDQRAELVRKYGLPVKAEE